MLFLFQMLKPTTLFAGCMLVMVATQVRADTEHYNYNLRSMPKKFCGRILADTLSIVCEGNYNGHMNKKSGRPEDGKCHKLIKFMQTTINWE